MELDPALYGFTEVGVMKAELAARLTHRINCGIHVSRPITFVYSLSRPITFVYSRTTLKEGAQLTCARYVLFTAYVFCICSDDEE